MNKATEEALFSGGKAKWLPLCRRFLARISRITGLDVVPLKGALALGKIGKLRVTLKGLDVAIKVSKPKGSKKLHKLLLTKPGDIDDELMTWVRAASLVARSARR